MKTNVTKGNDGRFMELEGLRGLASIVVVIYHNLLAFYPLAFYGFGTTFALAQHSRFEDNFYGSPIYGFLSGGFAVAIFFVLSGFVLSIKFFNNKDENSIKRMAIKRYPRLMLPALASTLFCFLLILFGLSNTQAAANITQSGWLVSNWNFVPNLIDAIWSGAVQIFISGANLYNNALWTMEFELIGSFIIFGFLLLFARSKYRWIVYIAALCLSFNTWILPFIVGMGFADLYAMGILRSRRRNWLVLLILFFVAVAFGSYPIAYTTGTIYDLPNKLPFYAVDYGTLFKTIGAVIMVFIVLWSRQFTQFLQKKKIAIFGKYTFSLYLVHLPILYAFTTGFFVLLYPLLGYNKGALFSMALSIPLLYVCTKLFEKYVDAPSIRFGSYVADKYFGQNRKSVRLLLISVLLRAKSILEDIKLKLVRG